MYRADRHERLSKARSLSERWGLLRTCRDFIKENSKGWKERGLEERKKIREEEKEERLKIVRNKKLKFRTKNWEKTEIETLESKTARRIELAEIKHNLWT